ncbi:MAG: ArsB/NhaD family transporter [Eggerthellaceae bacterium]
MFALTTAQIIAIVIFIVVMVLIVSEKVHRTVAALAGAVALILTGVVTFDIGVEHIDFGTLGVLVGMMIFVAVVKNSGIFEYLAIKAAKAAKGNPWMIMVLFCLITAVLSAFLDNVTTVLLIGPVTYTVCKMLEVNPIPFFITEIIASNVGGTATLIGDPPNIMIGSATGLTFFDFLMYDGPAVLIILVVAIGLFYLLYGKKMGVAAEKQQAIMTLHAHEAIKSKSLFTKSVVMIVLVAIAFVIHGWVHVEPSVVALAAAAVMMLISRAHVEETLEDVEWATIGFFAGLFVVVGGLAETGVIEMLAYALIDATGGDMLITIVVLVWASAIVSSFLDNIPMVATLIPIIQTMQATGIDVMPLWWAVSLGACIGGIGTLIGASANVVLAGMSTKYGHPITFMEYTKVGFPMMLVFTAIACAYLVLRFVVLA